MKNTLQDVLLETGLIIDFDKRECRWMEHTIPMKSKEYFKGQNYMLQYELFQQDEAEEDFIESFIADAKYEKATPLEIAEQQKHLSEFQRQQLKDVLSKFTILFDGKLGHYKEQLIHLEIDPKFPPVHSKPYSVPRAQQDIFLKELQHLVEIGVLRPCGPTEWASPTFIIPKNIDSTG